MNNVELMNLATNFTPHNAKIVNVNVESNPYRSEEVETIIVEYIFRAGEYTMILSKEDEGWQVSEIFDCFENSNTMMRGEKKPLNSTTPIFKTPVKIVPKEELIGNSNPGMGAQESFYGDTSLMGTQESFYGNTSLMDQMHEEKIMEENIKIDDAYIGKKGDKVLDCISGYNVRGRGKPTRVCVVERDVNKGGKNTKELYLTIQAINGPFRDEIKLSRYGINPNIGLFDITASKSSDVLISMQSGTEGGYYIYYVYSYINDKLTKIFDSNQFSKNTRYTVQYLDNYKVRIQGGIMNYEYFIDIGHRDELYLEKLYDGCKLRKPTSGYVSGIVNLYPVTINNVNIFQLHFISHILGVSDDDQLGGMIYVIGWKDNGFVVIEQRVVIRGDAPPDNYGLDKINPAFTVISSYIPKIEQD